LISADCVLLVKDNSVEVYVLLSLGLKYLLCFWWQSNVRSRDGAKAVLNFLLFHITWCNIKPTDTLNGNQSKNTSAQQTLCSLFTVKLRKQTENFTNILRVR